LEIFGCSASGGRSKFDRDFALWVFGIVIVSSGPQPNTPKNKNKNPMSPTQVICIFETLYWSFWEGLFDGVEVLAIS
jgi:hypothetical protein